MSEENFKLEAGTTVQFLESRWPSKFAQILTMCLVPSKASNSSHNEQSMGHAGSIKCVIVCGAALHLHFRAVVNKAYWYLIAYKTKLLHLHFRALNKYHYIIFRGIHQCFSQPFDNTAA